jgi:hypothetical protein
VHLATGLGKRVSFVCIDSVAGHLASPPSLVTQWLQLTNNTERSLQSNIDIASR